MRKRDKEKENARSKAWRVNNKEKYNADAKAYRESHRDYYTNIATKRNREKLYGFTDELYQAILVEQNYCCAICKRHRSEFNVNFCADHNHITGKPRGLLCHKCNSAIGLLQDSITNLAAAISYLEKY